MTNHCPDCGGFKSENAKRCRLCHKRANGWTRNTNEAKECPECGNMKTPSARLCWGCHRADLNKLQTNYGEETKCVICGYRTRSWKRIVTKTWTNSKGEIKPFHTSNVCDACIEQNGEEKVVEMLKGKLWGEVKEKKELEPVTLDLLREMRRQGRGQEARELYDAWRKNVEDNKKQIEREMRHRENLLRKQFLDKNKLCRICSQPRGDNVRLCFECAKSRRMSATRKKLWKRFARGNDGEKNKTEESKSKDNDSNTE